MSGTAPGFATAGPLSHLKVLDLSRVLAGPWAGQILADLGADVVRIDRAGGDGLVVSERDLLDRGRRSVVVDLKSEAGRAATLRLIAAADVLIEGFRPGVDSYSAFMEADRRTPTGLAGYLRERGTTRVWLAGLATDFCVHYSALDAVRLGFAVTLLEDACREIDLDGSHGRALAAMGSAGVALSRTTDLG